MFEKSLWPSHHMTQLHAIVHLLLYSFNFLVSFVGLGLSHDENAKSMF